MKSDAARVDDEIYKVESVPPPADDDPAYSAATKVGAFAKESVARIFADAAEAETAPLSGTRPSEPAVDEPPIGARSEATRERAIESVAIVPFALPIATTTPLETFRYSRAEAIMAVFGVLVVTALVILCFSFR